MVFIDALILSAIYDVRIISKVFEIIFIATKNNIAGYIITGLVVGGGIVSIPHM